MPRAFLLTNRRYNLGEMTHTGEHENEHRIGHEESRTITKFTTASDTIYGCSDELYNLTKLAEIAVATEEILGQKKTLIESKTSASDSFYFGYTHKLFDKSSKISRGHLSKISCTKSPTPHQEEITGEIVNHDQMDHECPDCGKTYRFMATGESFASLSFAFRISPGYISRIVKMVLHLLRERLPPIFMPMPTTDNLLGIAAEFSHKWNFPNCIAAVDGKHVRIFCPGKSGSLFFNYKDFFSIVLLAFVDANYKFLMVDIGSYGKEGDSGILAKSNIGKLLKDTTFYPPPSTLPNTNDLAPFIIVGDEAFRLSEHLMKPFPRNVARSDVRKAVFNYRLSRARRVSENAFALLSQVFRIFYLPIAVTPEVTDDLIMTACCFHNMLRDAFLEENKDFPQEVNLQDVPTKNMIPLRAAGGFANAEGFRIRDIFTSYFNSDEGSLSWQLRRVNQTDISDNI